MAAIRLSRLDQLICPLVRILPMRPAGLVKASTAFCRLKLKTSLARLVSAAGFLAGDIIELFEGVFETSD